MIKVTFLPDKKTVKVNKGTVILDALEKAGINISTPCGGKGTCGKCKVLMKEGIPSATLVEKNLFTEEEIKKGDRLACQTKLFQDSIIEIPSEIRLDFKVIFSPTSKGDIYPVKKRFSLDSNLKKVFLNLKKPSLADQSPDWERIKDVLSLKEYKETSSLRISLTLIKKIPILMREADFKITVTILNNEIIDIEKGDTTKNRHGIAFDIGTTTVAGYLVDLRTGKELFAVAKTNPQMIHGDDIISRIGFVQKSKDGLKRLQQEIVGSLNEIIEEATQKAKITQNNIYETVIAANTCMHHLFLGLNPVYLAPSPYLPVIQESLNLKAKEIPGLSLNPMTHIYMLPNISAFVGADISAGIIANDIWRKNKINLLVDLGTNGEIVLGYKGKLWACSTAVGPAFEGARISSGMRAADGAIDQVRIEDNLIAYKVIQNGKVRGICGSGLIDLIAELLKIGLINKSGRLISREECHSKLSEEMKKRITKGVKENQLLLAEGDETMTGQPIYLTQGDIREVQLAKAAICAGIRILLKEVNISSKEVEEILLAGAFGNFIDKKSAVRIGLIPNLPLKRIKSVGNAAGRGAEIALCSNKMRKFSEEVSKRVNYIELSSRPDFQKEFMEAIFF